MNYSFCGPQEGHRAGPHLPVGTVQPGTTAGQQPGTPARGRPSFEATAAGVCLSLFLCWRCLCVCLCVRLSVCACTEAAAEGVCICVCVSASICVLVSLFLSLCLSVFNTRNNMKDKELNSLMYCWLGKLLHSWVLTYYILAFLTIYQFGFSISFCQRNTSFFSNCSLTS